MINTFFGNNGLHFFSKNFPGFLWILDSHNNCIWANENILECISCTNLEEFNECFFNKLHPNDKDKFNLFSGKGRNISTSGQLEYQIKFKDGHYLKVQETFMPRFDEGGTFLGVMRIANKVCFESAFQNQYLELSDDGHSEWDLKNHNVSFSSHFWEMLGYEPQEIFFTDWSWKALVFPEDLSQMETKLSDFLQKKEDVIFNFEMRFIHKAGNTVWFSCRHKIIERDEGGSPLKMIGLYSNVTELKNTQAVLIQNAKLVELGELAAGIAHEVNNPLTVIVSRTSMINKALAMEDFDKEKVQAGIKQIHAMSIRIAKIVNGLKTLSRNADNDPMTEVFLYPILEESIDLCSEKFKFNSTDLKSDFESVKNISIRARGTQLSQVLINLLHNSLDAVCKLPNKWVEVKASCNEDRVVIIITDSGKGISQQVLLKMFNPFYTTKELGKGTGLGLSISKKIIEEHGGQLYYDQNSDHTCFVIKIPTAK